MTSEAGFCKLNASSSRNPGCSPQHVRNTAKQQARTRIATTMLHSDIATVMLFDHIPAPACFRSATSDRRPEPLLALLLGVTCTPNSRRAAVSPGIVAALRQCASRRCEVRAADQKSRRPRYRQPLSSMTPTNATLLQNDLHRSTVMRVCWRFEDPSASSGSLSLIATVFSPVTIHCTR